MSDHQDSKDRLELAIKQYFREVDPDVYIDDWILATQKQSTQLASMNQSTYTLVMPTEQPAHRTAGLLLMAADVHSNIIFKNTDEGDNE